jgi:hypothetical protein
VVGRPLLGGLISRLAGSLASTLSVEAFACGIGCAASQIRWTSWMFLHEFLADGNCGHRRRRIELRLGAGRVSYPWTER